MSKLGVIFKNCYGIKDFIEDFEFNASTENPKAKAYAIYAPNGTMKTSFTKTFEDIAKGERPKEERYNRQIKERVIGIEKATAALREAEVEDEKIIYLLQKYWDLRLSEAKELLQQERYTEEK